MSTPTRRLTIAAAPRRPETVTPSWEDRAACYNRPEVWWDGEDLELREKARATCLSCPVLAECLGEKMRLEAGQMWNRSGIRGGLTGSERVQLCIDEQLDGPYDAEEARLLALEAGAYGKPVAEIAEPGVSASTIRLAGRLAREDVPMQEMVKAEKGTALERALDHAEQIMLWLEDGVSRRAICERLRLGRTAVDSVIRTYRGLARDPDEAVPTVSDAEGVLINEYLNGQAVRLTHDQQLAAIVEGMKRGMRYPDIDRVRSLRANSTAQFVCRMRKRYERDGREFPVTTQDARRLKLTDVEVLAIRETYAAGGVRDMDLALKYGVSRNVISHVVSGRNYKHVGGPIRRGGKSDAAKQATREYMCGHATNSRAAMNQSEMEEAA